MNDYNDNEEPGFFRRYRIILGAGIAIVVVAAVAISVFFALSIHSAPPRKLQEIVVHLEPPPPLPPPPPPPPPPKEPPEQKMVEQPPVNKPEEKPKETLKAPDRPPSLPGPVAGGPPSDFGLGGSGGGGIGGGGGGGSKYGWYAGEVQKAVAEALRKNPKTHDASLHVKVRIWSDAAGRITRALLAESSGDSSLDDAVKNQVLTGLILPEAPPTDMPMPIVLRLNAQRPN